MSLSSLRWSFPQPDVSWPWSTSALRLALRLAVHCLPRCRTQLYLRNTPCPKPRTLKCARARRHARSAQTEPSSLPIGEDTGRTPRPSPRHAPRHALLSLGLLPSLKPVSSCLFPGASGLTSYPGRLTKHFSQALLL